MEKIIKENLFEKIKFSKEGLTSEEAEEKLKIFGFNEIKYFKFNIWEIIKRNIFNSFNLLLFLAAGISFITEGIKAEPILILSFLLVAILVAVIEDYQSNKLAQELLSYFKNYAFVKRDGKWEKIDAKYIAPGDLVKVKAGYIIPADLKIIYAENALTDESIITGENKPIAKNEIIQKETEKEDSVPSNIALAGTTLLNGEIEGVAFATGSSSYFGSLAKKTLEIEKETAYQKMMDDFAKKIGYFTFAIMALILLINFIKPHPIELKELFIFIIVLVVAIVPEFLPAMTILSLSLAGEKLAKRGLVIKRLSAIEDIGGTQILCVDKTGTITTNHLSLKGILSNEKKKLIRYFLADYYLAQSETAYEKTLLKKIKEMPSYNNIKLIKNYEFDPGKRIKRIIIEENSQKIEIIKGAPEQILKLLSLNEKESQKWLKTFKEEDQKGLRTLGIGYIIYKNDSSILHSEFLGILSFYDPIKKSAYEAMKTAKKLNIQVKILSGDAPNVVKQVAQQLDIIKNNEKIITADELTNLAPAKFKEIVEKTNAFARVFPEDKLKIIKTLQEKNFVGFLGEGINDAPALKIANVALAVENATDVAKEEADIILKEKDLKTIIDGIFEGRKTLENIGKYIKHTLSDNFGNLTFIAFLTLFLPFVPLTPLQVLLTDFITDLPILAFAKDKVSKDETEKPTQLSSYHLFLLLLILGGIAGITNILGYLFVRSSGEQMIRTFLFLLTTLNGLFVSLIVRTKKNFLKSKPSFFFKSVLILCLILTVVFLFVPPVAKIFDFVLLPKNLIIAAIFITIAFMVATELGKRAFYKKYPDAI